MTREDFRGKPRDAEPSGPESAGPFALLAIRHPDHPALTFAEEGFRDNFQLLTGSVGRRVVAETSYNIAYPNRRPVKRRSVVGHAGWHGISLGSSARWRCCHPPTVRRPW
jgi:hypothetical protein